MSTPAQQSLVLAPGPRERVLRAPDGSLLEVPEGWALLPPGDAGLTRRVKAAGPSWTVKEKRGRRLFSRGVWAPAAHIEAARATLSSEREDPAYQRRLEAGRLRRAKAQVEYVHAFTESVERFLDFHPRYEAIGRKLAMQIAAHATPVGSGTVARTERIPIERRAEAAVIAWMRHQTTAYDHIAVPRVKGARRALRRQLAARSRELLQHYREGRTVDPERCPLARALTAS